MSLPSYQLLHSAVGMAGFEPAAPCPPDKCSTRLSHIPLVTVTAEVLLQKVCYNGRMARPQLRPPKIELEALYLQEGLTLRMIASRFGVCRTTVSKWMALHGLSSRLPGRKRGPSIEGEVLRKVVASSVSFAEVLRRLELPKTGSSHLRVKRLTRQLGLDTSHFLGQRSNQGTRHRGNRRKPWQEILVKRLSGSRSSVAQLRRALQEIGRSPVCCKCKQEGSWQGEPLVLETHHVNGDPLDDRPENLERLCPNCHSQTKNHRFKKRL